MTTRSHRGRQVIKPHPGRALRAERARQDLDYGRRPTAGFVFGALQPRTGETLTATYTRRNIDGFVDFLDRVEGWIPQEVERVYAVLDNLSCHSAYDVLLFNLAHLNLAHLRWEFVSQPKRAPYLNLIELWWKTLKSLALKGCRFEAWVDVEIAIQRATTYWNDHKHPYVWGRRRRHRMPRRFGLATVPATALL